MKPSPDRLQLANYPHSVDIPVRFSDLDVMNHINNVAVGEFYEEGRAAFNGLAMRRADFDRRRLRMVMVSVAMNYLREGRYPGQLTVATGVTRVGESSFTIAQALFQKGECIGASESTTVNTQDGVSAPLPPEFRSALEALRFGQPAPQAADASALAY